jgi:hypothetical protein
MVALDSAHQLLVVECFMLEAVVVVHKHLLMAVKVALAVEVVVVTAAFIKAMALQQQQTLEVAVEALVALI